TATVSCQTRVLPRLPRSTIFPYTTLFRSLQIRQRQPGVGQAEQRPGQGAQRGRALAIGEQCERGDQVIWILAQQLAEPVYGNGRSEEHTSELQSPDQLVCRLLLERKHRVL